MRLPSGLQATLLTPISWPETDWSSLPLSASQSFVVLSALAEAMRLPSGLQATLLTANSWPENDWSNLPLSASQSFIVPSQLAEAMRLLSGLHAAARAPARIVRSRCIRADGVCVLASQRRIAPSPYVAARVPFALHETDNGNDLAYVCKTISAGSARPIIAVCNKSITTARYM